MSPADYQTFIGFMRPIFSGFLPTLKNEQFKSQSTYISDKSEASEYQNNSNDKITIKLNFDRKEESKQTTNTQFMVY